MELRLNKEKEFTTKASVIIAMLTTIVKSIITEVR